MQRDQREETGRGDRWSEQQRSLMPDLDSSFVGFQIEMLFSYTNEEDGTQYVNWAQGRVKSIVNKKTQCVEIIWDDKCLSEGEAQMKKHKLLVTKWNPKLPKEGAWREYLTK